jgi:hypothetical protein
MVSKSEWITDNKTLFRAWALRRLTDEEYDAQLKKIREPLGSESVVIDFGGVMDVSKKTREDAFKALQNISSQLHFREMSSELANT